MKKIILLLFLMIFAKSQSQGLNEGTIKSKDYFVEIPFEFINGKIIIPVEINKITYRFVLDTGAPNVLSKKLSSLINPNLKKLISVSDSNNKKSDMGLISIPELIIGNITFENSSALVLQEDKNLFFDCFEVDGLIGSNLFRNSIIQIDAKSKTLRITNDEKLLQFNKLNKLKLKLIGNQKSPYMQIKIKNVVAAEEWVLFDTGMDNFYDLSKKHYDIFKKHNIFSDLGTGTGGQTIGAFGAEEGNKLHKCLLTDMKIGQILFKNIEVVTTNDDNSRIGASILKYSIVTVDFNGKKIYFDLFPENIDKTAIDLVQKSRGLGMSIANNKIVVGVIWDEVLNSKISVGDEITNINGVNYENKDICEIITAKSIMKNNKPVEIIVKSKTGEYIKLSL